MVDIEGASESLICDICISLPFLGGENNEPLSWKTVFKIILFFGILIAIMSIAALIVK
jgi:hypothetical protein